MKCANCDRQARYLDAPPGMSPVYYCRFDLPPNLQEQADNGMLDIPEDADDRPAVDEAVQEARATRRGIRR